MIPYYGSVNGGPPEPITALSPIAWYRYGVGIDTSGWADQSGNGNDMTFTATPTVDVNGVTFNGTTQYGRAAFTLNQPCTCYALWFPVAAAASARIVSGAINGTTFFFSRWSAAATVVNIGAPTAVNNISTTAGSWMIESTVMNDASSVHQRNNNSPATATAGTNAAGGVTLSASEVTVATLFSNTAFKEVIVFPVAHDAATRAIVITYLATVGGLNI